MTITAAETRLGDPQDGLNGDQRRVLAQVAEHGWRSTAVAGPPGYPSFTYTTGFWLTFDAPEIMIFDLPSETAHDMFGVIARDLTGGRKFLVGEPAFDILQGEHVRFVPVDAAKAAAYLMATAWFYRGAAFPCWQLVWGDSAGRFPWDDGFDPGLVGVQPDLSTNGDWGGAGRS